MMCFLFHDVFSIPWRVCPALFVSSTVQAPLQVYEHYNSGLKTLLPPGDVVPFWTLANTDRMVVMTGEGKESTSDPFLFKRPANLVLQFSNKNKVSADYCSCC